MANQFNINIKSGSKVNQFDIGLQSKNVFGINLREGGSTPGPTPPVAPTDYETLLNKPRIEGVTLIGNKTFEDLHMNALTNIELEKILK